MTTATAAPEGRRDRLYTFPTPDLLRLRASLFGLQAEIGEESRVGVRGVIDSVEQELKRRRDAGERSVAS